MAIPLIIIGGAALVGLIGGVVAGRESTDIVPADPPAPGSVAGVARTAISVAPVLVIGLAAYGGYRLWKGS